MAKLVDENIPQRLVRLLAIADNLHGKDCWSFLLVNVPG
jgi:hypothetical protein